jgi:GT2 family glycosyltransferase
LERKRRAARLPDLGPPASALVPLRGHLRGQRLDRRQPGGGAERLPSIRALSSRRNVGFQKGNNLGFAAARGREILLLNPDTRVLPGSLDALIGFLRSRPDAGAASPRCVRPDGTLQWATAPFPSLPIIRHWFWTAHPALARLAGRPAALVRDGDAPCTQEQAYAYGACMAVRREAIDTVGPMDERFFLAGGEVAWSREMARRGWKIYYVAEATIEHRESTARRRRPFVNELDWIAAHRRLLYFYEGVRAGMMGDVIFSLHLLLEAGARLAGPLARTADRGGATGSGPA